MKGFHCCQLQRWTSNLPEHSSDVRKPAEQTLNTLEGTLGNHNGTWELVPGNCSYS